MTKLAVGIWAYGRCAERYVSDGYREAMPFERRLENVAALEGVSGVELSYPGDIDEANCDEIQGLLERHNLRIASIIPEIVCEAKWQRGALTAMDDGLRSDARARIKGAMDMASRTGTKIVNIWPGQDGFDYAFEVDYARGWELFVEGLAECAAHRPEIKLAIEYKMSEPRMKCYAANAGTALALSMATGRPNVGVALDIGHSFNAGENPAMSVALLAGQGRLFHVHINDNYGIADDDMPAGSVHWPQWFEFVHWLRKVGYDDWISLDMYPYRDDPQNACGVSMEFFRLAERVAGRMSVGYDASPSEVFRRIMRSFAK